MLEGVRTLTFSGVNVTYPYKVAVVPLLDELDPSAAKVGAVNTVAVRGERLIGFNTDCSGFKRGVRREIGDVAGQTIALIGAGGVGKAIGVALAESGVGRLNIVDREPARAQRTRATRSRRIATRRLAIAAEQALAGAQGLINATAVGMLPNRDMPAPARSSARRSLGRRRGLSAAMDAAIARRQGQGRKNHDRPRTGDRPGDGRLPDFHRQGGAAGGDGGSVRSRHRSQGIDEGAQTTRSRKARRLKARKDAVQNKTFRRRTRMANVATQEPSGAHQPGKAAASGWIGSALEYYDFFIYATAASLIFPQIFFPSGNPTVAIVASLATYGVGYVARPIGAFVLGHWGDTHGRKQVLLVCMFLMGFSTMAVGLLPTYQQVGMLAPMLLVVLRLIQGFAVAGEISGASSMILEHAPFGRRGFYASFALQGVQAGQILAAAVFLPLAHFMPEDAFNAWGWRIPFLLSFVVIVAGYIIRREVEETPAFAEEGARGEVPKSPIVQAFALSWKDMLRVVCMALMNVIPVVATIFGAAYAVQAAYGIGFHKDVYLWIPVLGNIVAVLVIPFVGNLSDKIGRRPPIIVGALGVGPAVVRLSLRHQHPQRAAGDRHVAADVGRRLSGL